MFSAPVAAAGFNPGRQSRRLIAASDLVAGDLFAGAGAANLHFIPAEAVRTVTEVLPWDAGQVRVSYSRPDGQVFVRVCRSGEEFWLLSR